MKIVITGANGFVGPHLVSQLRKILGRDAALFPTAMKSIFHPHIGEIRALDVTDKSAVDVLIAEVRPTHVVNLAGLAATSAASANAALAWQVHLFGALNIAHAIRQRAPDCVLVSVGSGQVYGASARTGRPLDETVLLAPSNTYEVTKACADIALGALASEGLASIRFRPFNHTGPGQSEAFVIPSFAMQIARIEAGLQPPVLKAGNLKAERDFLDVRDVAAAYALAVAKSQDIPAGTVLNVASGIPRRIQVVLDELLAMSRVPIVIVSDSTRMRPSDTPRFLGDASLAKRLLGWKALHNFDTTLADVLSDCRQRLLEPVARSAQ